MRQVRYLCGPCASRGVLVDGQEYQITGPKTTLTVCPACQARYLDPLTTTAVPASQNTPAAPRVPSQPAAPPPSTKAPVLPKPGPGVVECLACTPPARTTTRGRANHVFAHHRGKHSWEVPWRALPDSGLDACPHPDCHGYPVGGLRGLLQHAKRAHPGNTEVVAEFRRRHQPPCLPPAPRPDTANSPATARTGSTRTPRVLPAGHSMVECHTCDPPARLVSDERYGHARSAHPGARVWDVRWKPLPGSNLAPCPHPDCHGYPVTGVAGKTAHAHHAHHDDTELLAEFRRRQATAAAPARPTRQTRSSDRW